MLESVFMGYVLNHGGGWTNDVDIPDGIELTNAQSLDETHTKRCTAIKPLSEKTRMVTSFPPPLLRKMAATA